MSAPAALAADLELVCAAVDEAAGLAMTHFERDAGHWYKGPGQVLTAADLEVDQLLRRRLLAARPDYGWLSEESADDGSRWTCRRVWVVDPIDGTRAFADRRPEFTISVGLVEDGQPLVGVVHNPATGERFEAVRGAGARLGDEPLRVSTARTLEDASLLSSRGEMRKRRWFERIPETRFAAVSSLAYKLALVAAGRHDGLMSLRGSHDWDLAAALLLLDEAGAISTDAEGRPLRLNQRTPRHQGLAIAATPELHAEVLTALRALA